MSSKNADARLETLNFPPENVGGLMWLEGFARCRTRVGFGGVAGCAEVLLTVGVQLAKYLFVS